MKDLKDIGVLIRVSEAIYESGYSYNELAKKLGCTRKTLYNYRDMVSSMKIEHFKKFCELTGADPLYILYGKEV